MNPTLANQIAAQVAQNTGMSAPVTNSTNFYGSGNWTYSPDDHGGVNYFRDGTPVTNTQYARATGANTGQIEQNAAVAFSNGGASGGGSSSGSSSSGYSSGYGSGYATPNYAALENAYTANFDAQDKGLVQSEGLAKEIAQTGQDRLESSYNVQKGGLDQNLAYGNANLDASQSKLDLAKANSLRDLGNSLRLAMQSYSNQAGVNGAGDSSAADVINYALSNEGNRASNDIHQNVAQQQTGLNLQRTQLQGSYDQNKKMLDDWHATQLQSIINTYAQTVQQIEQARTNAKGQKAIDLAYIGKGQAANQAIQEMQNLQATYNGNLSQLQSSYSNISAPNASLPSNLTDAYNVQAITPDQINLGTLSNTNNTAPVDSSYAVANIKKNDQSTTS